MLLCLHPPPLLRLLFLFLFLSLSLASSSRLLLDTFRRHTPSHSLTFPVFHSSSLLRPPPSRRLTLQSSTSNQTLDLRSQLITLDEPSGQYFALLELGTPAREITVIIDTGSQLLWVQCEPCVQCGVQIRDPIFDPTTSASYQTINCSDPVSASCTGDDSVALECSTNDTCVYHVSYGDNSNSTGYLSKETVTFDTATGTTFQLREVVFGCGVVNNGVESSLNASGLMGLDRGNYSIPSQLGVEVFSYCLPNRVQNVHSSGYLTFGNRNNSASKNLSYTALVANDASQYYSQFYYVKVTGVSVNGQRLDIPASAFEIDNSTGYGGTVVDSGTTLTSFVNEAYMIVASAFDSAMGSSAQKVQVTEDSTQLCYQVPSTQNQAPNAPNVTIHLDGPVDLDLGNSQIFHLMGSDSTHNYFCLAFTDAGDSPDARNFIGNYQQQDYLVEYDLVNSRIGFAPTQCSTSSNTSSGSRRQSYVALGLIPLLAFFILL